VRIRFENIRYLYGYVYRDPCQSNVTRPLSCLRSLNDELQTFKTLISWSGVRLESTRYFGHCLAYCTSPGWWMVMSVEQSVECLAKETEILGENLPQCLVVHHKSHMT
jgi:hypothetical protein